MGNTRTKMTVYSAIKKHINMYAYPIYWLLEKMGELPEKDSPLYTTKSEDFINRLLIPISFSIALVIACFIICIGLSGLLLGILVMIITCCCCISCLNTGSYILAYFTYCIVFICGGISMLFYTLFMVLVWPILVIVYGIRLCKNTGEKEDIENNAKNTETNRETDTEKDMESQ
jgi:uncharacterized membrane protein